MVDTGSDITAIATKDCYAMGLSFNKLGRPLGSISGLTDKARRWEIDRAELRAISANKQRNSNKNNTDKKHYYK